MSRKKGGFVLLNIYFCLIYIQLRVQKNEKISQVYIFFICLFV